MDAEEVLEQARAMRRASDAFDAALAGFAELVAAGDLDGAEAVAREVFEQWRRHREAEPEWAEHYSAEVDS